jgi:hypothetical protein
VQRKKLLSEQSPSEVFLLMALQSAQLESFLKTEVASQVISLCVTEEWRSVRGRPQIHLCRECDRDRFQLVARPVASSGLHIRESYPLISLHQFLPFIRHVLTGGDDADRALLVHVFQQVSRICRSLEQHVDVQGYRGPSLRRLTHLIREQLSEELSASVIRIDLPDECEDLKREESPLRWLRLDNPGQATA